MTFTFSTPIAELTRVGSITALIVLGGVFIFSKASAAPALTLPPGFSIATAAQGLGRARFMDKSPDGRIFVADMKNLSDNAQGKIYILSQFNALTKKFENKTTYLANLRNPNSVAFYTDKTGQHWLYIALTNKLIRYRYALNENKPAGQPQTIAVFPAYGLGYKYGGWHLTRTVKINNHQVYVAIGSSCDSCEEKTTEKMRASIMQMNPDGSNQKVIVAGLRNAVGLAFKNNDLYATVMGADGLGDDRPEDTFYKIKAGVYYGWPYCYQYQAKIYQDTSKKWRHKFDCAAVPLAAATFPAHSAPLGLAFFDAAAAPEMANSFLVALHGSSTVERGRGYKIVRIDEQGGVADFITGFLQGGVRYGRPVDILPASETSFFFTDDFTGTLYYVYKNT